MAFFLDLTNQLLIGLAIMSGALLLWPSINQRSSANALSAAQTVQLINQRHAVVCDIRSPEEYAQGSILGAKNLATQPIEQRGKELAKYKNKPLLVVCQTDQQSRRLIRELQTEGLGEIYYLAGGLNAWQQAGLPLIKPIIKK